MTVIEMVAEHLKAHGYDGLVSEDSQCGCETEDLAPCCEIKADCAAAHKVACTPSCDDDNGNHEYVEGGWHMVEGKRS